MSTHAEKAFVKLDGRLPSWARQMIRSREWQRSSLISALVWVFATLVIYKLVERLGHGWKVNTAVSLAFDTGMYLANKLWAFREREATYAKSCYRNLAAWLLFFALNGAMAWLLMSRADVSTLPARGLLGFYGLAMNPVMFTIRDKVIFSQLTLRKLADAGWRTIRRTAMA